MNKAFKLDTGNDSLHSIGGIFLGGQVLQQSEIDHEFSAAHKANHIFQDVDIFKSQVGLLIQGRERFTDISQFRENEVFMKSLGLNKVPSEERLRQRLEMMSSKHESRLKSANTKLLKKQSIGTLSKGGMDFIRKRPLATISGVLDECKQFTFSNFVEEAQSIHHLCATKLNCLHLESKKG